MNEPLRLRPLLAALRQAKIRVGPHEVLRLRQVFLAQPRLRGDAPSCEPPLSDAQREKCQCERLRAILAAVLVKRTEDRKAFDDLFDAWYRLARSEYAARAPVRSRREPEALPSVPPQPLARATPPTHRAFTKARWLLAAAVIAVLGIAVWFSLPPAEVQRPVTGPDHSPAPEETATQRPRERDTYRTFLPEIVVEGAPTRWTGWPALLLGLFGLDVAWTLWRRLHGRTWLPQTTLGVPQPGGPPQAFLRAPDPDAVILLDKPQEELLVWGIERFVSDEPTRRLDLPATVRAIARQGGLPALHFQHAVRHPEVWLWTDTAARGTHTERLAAEVARVIDAYGLHCERAEFHGIPEYLCMPDGQTFGPREVDERRDTALVAILTDGRLLARRYHADPARRVRIDALLRLLSHWPHLAWVDFGRGASGLSGILAAHGLTLIAPEQLAAHIGGGTLARTGTPLGRDDQLWAAVCALPPAPVEEADALALLRRLDLDTSAWALAALRVAAPGPGGRLQWEPQRRARLLAWLGGLESSAADGGGAAQNSLLGRALAFWEGRYDEALGAAGGETDDTAAHRRLRAERALLLLWRKPGEAIAELHELAQGKVGDFIRAQLAGLTDADARRPPPATPRPCIPLPWRWAERNPLERLMLQDLGFGCAALAPEHPRQPGRFWLGVGLCAGLAAGALLAALGKPSPTAVGTPEIAHEGAETLDVHHRVVADGGGRWRVTVTGEDSLTEQADVPEGARVRVRWTAQERSCTRTLPLVEGGGELRYCGTLEGPVRLPDPEPPIHRRLAVLATDPAAPGVGALASALLDGGSADQVLIDPAWPRHSPQLTGTGGTGALYADDQLLLLTPAQAPDDSSRRSAFSGLNGSLTPASPERLWLTVDDWAALAAALEGFALGTTRSAATVWPALAVVAGDPQRLLLGGTGGCQPAEWTDAAHGITWVELCGGTFTMGSPPFERGRNDDERQHPVTLSPFAIARTETTNAQYRTAHPGPPGEDDLPVANVDWQEARDFCRAVGGDLPTEAQWEYAARAGTTTAWSFGDDEALLGAHAWYWGNSDGRAQPVATKRPNPWGLYDMHGSLWEWVADWYGPYPDAAQTDPTGPRHGDSRVLRGGSFDLRAEGTRSAYRVRGRPVFRLGYIGFRCARAPRRQP